VAPARLAAFGAPPRADALGASDRVLLFLGNVCLSPILGAVLYFVWRDSRPTRARQVCTLTWWAVGVWGVFFLLMVLGAVASEL
jgi:hypothetical protein